MVERDGKAATLLEDVVASVHTATALTKAATAAVSFLEAEFASHAPRIRAARAPVVIAHTPRAALYVTYGIYNSYG